MYFTADRTIVGESRDGVIINMIGDNFNGFYPDDATLKLYNVTLNSDLHIGKCVSIRDVSDGTVINNVRFTNCYYGISGTFWTGVPSNAQINNNIFQDVDTALVLTSATNTWVNSTFYNNTLIDTTNLYYSYVDGSISESTMDIKDNTITVDIYTISDENLFLFDDNTINYKRLKFSSFNPTEQYVVEGFDIDFDTTLTSSTFGVYLVNSSNILFKDITICNNSTCNFDNTGVIIYAFAGDINPSNIVIDNFRGTVISNNHFVGIGLSGDNITVKNSYLDVDSPAGAGFKINGDNAVLENNILHFRNNSMSYAVGCGNEGISGDGRILNCLIKDNTVYANYDKVSTTLHTYFMGYTESSNMIDNTQYGGGYAHVIKGNINAIVDGSKIYEGANNEGILEKGGHNGIFRNIYIETKDNENRIFDLRSNSADNFSVQNSTWENIEIVCSGVSCGFSIAAVGDVYFKDVLGNYAYTPGPNATVYEYNSITLDTDNKDLTFTITNENTSETQTFNSDTYIPTYFYKTFRNSTTTLDESSYSFSAAKYDQTDSGSFILSAPYTLQIDYFSTHVVGVNNTRTVAFAAFALIAVMILGAIAMLFIGIFNNGADLGQMMTVTIWAIGAAIVLMIGYIIISAVAGGLI